MSKRRERREQLGLIFERRGGKRRGAGRKPKGARAGVAHVARAELSGREPVLITLKVLREIASLRGRRALTAVLRSIRAACDRHGMRIIQLSVQHDHAHLIVEASSRAALARAVQALCVRIARAINRALRRTGTVFADRYHDRVLGTPRQVRNALRYVLGNGRKHGVISARTRLDPCSTAAAFDGWRDAGPIEGDRIGLFVVAARTWLLTVGWRRGGLLDPFDRPGPLPR